MKLLYPLPKQTETQGFAKNLNPLYQSQGLVGHTGIDFGGAWGEGIKCAASGYVYSRINMGGTPNKYRALFTITEGEDGYVYEVSYGHIIDSPCNVGDWVTQGDVIASIPQQVVARVGNYGDVYSGGHYVTNEEKRAGSHAGSHLHFQVRRCRKVKSQSFGKVYLFDQFGVFKKDGYYFQVINYNNGLNGCIDPQPMLDGTYKKYQFEKDLRQGVVSDDVYELQVRLNKMGYVINESGSGSPGNETDYFGPLTTKALSKFQKDNNISPAEGYFGPKTRAAFNS